MPRNTNLTLEVQAQIARYVNAGAPIPHACEAVGVPWPTCKDWLRKGRKGIKPYAAFVAAMKQAKAAHATGSVLCVTKAGGKDWRAAAWILERRYPKHYAPPSRFEVSGKDGKAIETSGSLITYVVTVPKEEPDE